MSQDKKEEVQPKEEGEKQEAKVVKVTVLTELLNVLFQLSKSLISNDTNTFLRLTKQIRRFKKPLKPHHMQRILNVFFPGKYVIDFAQYNEYDANYDPEDQLEIPQKKKEIMQEHEEIFIYLELMLLIFFLKFKDNKKAYDLAGELFKKSKEVNKRHVDNLNSLIYFYYSRTRELNNELIEIRDELFASYRTCCLRHDEIGQATILNLLLRNYLHFNHYESAQHMISKTTFPESKSNNEFCRYLYYTGKIKAIRLEYPESLSRLNQAIRKAPDTTALGFRIEAQKLACVVEMLIGDIPSRDIFAQPEMQNALYPYYKLVQSVLKGNLLDYSTVVAKYATRFIKDNLYTLVLRLHQSVIKAGLRKINLSYSRISFQDIREKLNLSRNNDVEFIIAKAIRDGVLTGQIDHEKQYVIITEKKDLYTSTEPQQAYMKRINYCFNLHTAATKALEYPNKKFKKLQEKKDDQNDFDILDLFDEFDF